jgi:hypothetical protein
MDISTEDLKRKRFLWGALLAWVPFVLLLGPGIVNAVKSSLEQKATGLGAVAGGAAEVLISFGFVALVVCETAAIVLLLRAFSREHPVRSFVSVVSLCCCGLTMALFSGMIWLLITGRS